MRKLTDIETMYACKEYARIIRMTAQQVYDNLGLRRKACKLFKDKRPKYQ